MPRREPLYPHQPKKKESQFPHIPNARTIDRFTVMKGHRDTIIITRVPHDPARSIHITTAADKNIVLDALTERERRGLDYGMHIEIREDEPRAAVFRQLWERNEGRREGMDLRDRKQIDHFRSMREASRYPQVIEGAEPIPPRYQHLADWLDEPVPQVKPVPPRYRHLTGWLDEPMPDVELMPAVDVPGGERKVEVLLKKLEAGVETIHQSDNFRLFLTTMSKFHTYSFGNQILIMFQKPEATHVAGFVTWKELGRWVKRGESGIAILAPVLPPRPICPECGAKIPKSARFCPGCGADVEAEVEGMEPRYFRTVHVFDISQTDGKPLPEFDVPVLTGEANEELLNNVMALMQRKGVTVGFEPQPHMAPDIKGYYKAPGEIWVRPGEPPAQQLKTLLHEAAHHYSASVFRIPRADAETIAESAAYVVGAHYGFDTGVRSFPYVALWSKDKKVLKANLQSIRQVATRMLEEIEK